VHGLGVVAWARWWRVGMLGCLGGRDDVSGVAEDVQGEGGMGGAELVMRGLDGGGG
jgi:hypothetical protein